MLTQGKGVGACDLSVRGGRLVMARPQPPGPRGLPFIGTLFTNLREPVRTAMHNYRRYGNVVRINFMGYQGAVLHGAAANRFILVDGVDHFVVEPLYERA